MKMAAAEALYEHRAAARRSRCSRSDRSTAPRRRSRVKVPGLLSFLATGSFDGEVEGINDLQAQYEETVRPDPGALRTRRRLHAEHPRDVLELPAHDRLRDAGRRSWRWSLWLTRGAGAARQTPLGRLGWRRRARCCRSLANVVRLDLHRDGPPALVGLRADDDRDRRLAVGRAPATVLTSLIVFTLLYGVLAVVEIELLMVRYVQGRGPSRRPRPTTGPTDDDADRPLSFAY